MGTTDMIFFVRQFREKAREQIRNHCMTFIDFRKAFDSINRNMMWLVLRKFGYSLKFVGVVRAFHDNMTASVAIGEGETNHFRVK